MTEHSGDTAYWQAWAYARREGRNAGRNAAEWYVMETFGGRVNPPHDVENARGILRGIEDGDPAVLDTLPYPDLSGEWADTLTGPQLVEDAYYPNDPDMDAFTDICDAYETAFSQESEDFIVQRCNEILNAD